MEDTSQVKTDIQLVNCKVTIQRMKISNCQDSKFFCGYSGKVLRTKKNLAKHVNSVHVKDFSFICTICGAKFAEPTSLSRHESNKKLHMKKTLDEEKQCNFLQ